MKALLMHRDRDFVSLEEVPRPGRFRELEPQPAVTPPQAEMLRDLEVDTLLDAMAGGDAFLRVVALRAILSGQGSDLETIAHRQAILRDALDNPGLIPRLYGIAVEAIEGRKDYWWGIGSRFPGHVLRTSVDLLRMYMGKLRKLRDAAGDYAPTVRSEGLATFFGMLRRELDDEYLEAVDRHLDALRFRGGMLMSAGLGERNEGAGYTLRQNPDEALAWWRRALRRPPPGFTFRLDPRDEAGPRLLSDICDRGLNDVANALGQSTEHVLGFFEILRTELAFYMGCVNLHGRLAAAGMPVCFPGPEPAGTRRLRFGGLYEACLALTMGRRVVGNGHDADQRSLVVVTGANQGGKTTFLRAIGQAQLMMQAGLFVGADSFAGEICRGVYTHFKREEDPTMKSGKLDEELSRLGGIADAVGADSLVLFNESFAATNEREGSEIARQAVRALLEKRIKVFFVTHLYDFAHGLAEGRRQDVLFLRAERLPDGTRTFRLVEGAPLRTSHGEDLYREVFGAPAGAPRPPSGLPA